MIISQEQEEIRAALALNAKCELKRVALRECRLTLEGSEETLQGPFAFSISHSSVVNSAPEGLMQIQVRFDFESHDKSDPPMPLFKLRCAFNLDYEFEDKSFQPPPESIAAFKDGNAVFNCWPYVREFVQSMTSRMELHPPALPLLRIVPKPKPKPKPQPKPESQAAPEADRWAGTAQPESSPEKIDSRQEKETL